MSLKKTIELSRKKSFLNSNESKLIFYYYKNKCTVMS